MRHHYPMAAAIAAISTAVLLAACGGDSPTGPGTKPVATVTVTPPTANLTVGQTQQLTAAMKDASGAALTGRSVAWSSDKPGTADVNATTGLVTGKAAGSAIITATSEGKSGSATITVAAAQTPAFSMTIAPATLSVQQNASGTATMTIARTGGFTGSVALAATGAPTGVTVTIAPTSVTGSTATVTVAAASGAAVASSTLTITGTATGVTSQTVTLPLAVTPGASSSGNVTFSYCAEDAPIFVAYQDASGSWRRATAGATNTYTFTIANGGGGIAAIKRVGTDGYGWSIIYGTPAELNASGGTSTQVCVPSTGKTVTGTVTGLGTTQSAFVTLGSASTVVTGATGGAFTLRNVPNGPQDLIATRANLSTSGGPLFTVDKVIIRRNLNPPDNSALAALDFGATEAFAPATANATVAGIGTDSAGLSVSYMTGNTSTFGTFAPFYSDFGLTSASATRLYYGVPAANQVSGDLHALMAFAYPPGGSATSNRFAMQFFRTVADQTLTLGPALSTPTVTVAATAPYLRPRMQLPAQPQYNRLANVSYDQRAGTASSRDVTIIMTAGYIGSASTFDFQIPDLSGLTGFDPAWGLAAGVATNWSASMYGGSLALGLPGVRPPDGASVQAASRSGSVPTGASSILRR